MKYLHLKWQILTSKVAFVVHKKIKQHKLIIYIGDALSPFYPDTIFIVVYVFGGCF